jgi:hypothetical protein
MKPLDKPLRNILEKTVKEARKTAEDAARASLEQLGVGEPAPFAHLTDSERGLRRRLRVHGRQLGDTLNGGKDQTMDRLMEEVAYQHWHRMLFARFLAENNLLMYPDPDGPVAITLEECEDLASDEGAANGWELAARYAARMLPQIFRLESPVFQLTLPPEHQQKLEHLVADLPLEVFIASDSLGWVYQFWQARKKDEVNASEVKIGARELPAVTQLFTEPYMVSFLLDNSLGAWWAARRLSDSDLRTAAKEEELRAKAAIPGVPLDYLRFVQQEDGTWTPAAGTFDEWPEHLKDLKTLDPCCGSGHFLVAAFLMLAAMRMELENLSARDAVDAVLQDNIHGLEIDQRCVELAAFALALSAWTYPGAGGYRVLPEMNVACSGLSISTKKEEWLALAGDNTNLRFALEGLYKQFKDAPILGSLINPETSLCKGSLFELKWDEVGPLLTKALAGEKNDEKAEMGVVARGVAKAADMLSSKYEWVITNVPYLARGNQSDGLKNYCTKNYPRGQQDLANVFLERCFDITNSTGVMAAVTPQNWLFRSRYKPHREFLLKTTAWKMLARLGPGAFDTISGHVVQAILILLKNRRMQPSDNIVGIDASSSPSTATKAECIKSDTQHVVSQHQQLNSPGCRITLFPEEGELLDEAARGVTGLITKDAVRFFRSFWEILITEDWSYGQTSVSECQHYDGLSKVVCWEQDKGVLRQQYKKGISILAGGLAWGKPGVCVSQTGVLPSAIYSGSLFDDTVAVIIPENPNLVPAVWTFCESGEFGASVRKINQALKVTPSTLVKVSFDAEYWLSTSEKKYPHGLPKPYSNNPTQWTFHGHPCGSVIWDETTKWTAHGTLRTDDTVLHVLVARLLGYRWPAELDPNMELADEQREWVNRCNYLLSFADEDGIVCIPPVRGEASAVDRLLNLLAAAYGDAWSNNLLARLLKNADHAGKTLESWLRDKFFTQHCKLFKHRPFIWHIWDGLKDGFAALVNYHKLDTKHLETLIYTYLGDWINRQKQDIIDGVDGAQERLDAAEALKKKLELIHEGQAPYDIFVRWKPIDQQPMGWDPDLNDGVRLNIRPFMSVPAIRKKGAGVLRDKPNIKWTKDRGKDVVSAPWYHLFKGDRINEHHLTLSEKRIAREA